MNIFLVGILTYLFVTITANQDETNNHREKKLLLSSKNMIFEAPIPLWDGRLLLSLAKRQNPSHEEEKKDKQLKMCISSTNEIGVCTRLSRCHGFKLSTLHNNICFMDIFIPGVCCVQPVIPPTFPINQIDSETTLVEETTPVSKKKIDEEKSGTNSSIVIDDLNCGIHTIPSSRIINGNESPKGKWPWMAAIYTNTFLGKSFHCGGSLISSNHVLTGAHCVKDQRGNTLSPSQITVRLGDNNVNTLNDFDGEETGRFYRVQSISAHPKFRNINHYFMNDVAVLKLTEEVKFSDFISPICLPSPSSETEPLDKFAGRMSTVTGYGRTELGIPSGRLLEAKVPVWKNEDCDASYFAPITEIFICAGYKMGGTDACQGDSGGPLQIEENNRWMQIGITSFGKGCGEAGFPGVYARLGKFVKWIRSNML